MGDTAETSSTNPTMIRTIGVMPAPGQPGAPEFTGEEVSEFLDHWEMFCEDYGFNGDEKCRRLPRYCTKPVKELVEILSGYADRNWNMLKKELKELFWQKDKAKNSTTELIKLVREAPTMDLNVYILKYSSITDALIKRGAMSTLDRVGRLLDGLSEELRKKVMKFCTKKSWRLSAQDTGTEDPNFEALKAFILTEAQTLQKYTVYDKERGIRDGTNVEIPLISASKTTTSPTPAISAAPIASITPTMPATVTPDPIAELSKKLEQLTLLVQRQSNDKSEPRTTAPTVAEANVNASKERPRRCVYCDSNTFQERLF